MWDVQSCSAFPQNYQNTLKRFKKAEERFSTVTNLKDIKIEALEKRVVIETNEYRYVISLINTKALGSPQNLIAGSLIRIKNGKEYGMALGTEEHMQTMIMLRALIVKQINILTAASKDRGHLIKLLEKMEGLLKHAEQKKFCNSLTENF